MGTPEEIESNQTPVNLQGPALFLKSLLKKTNGEFQNKEWYVATKNSNWEKSSGNDGQCSWNSFNSWRPAPNSYIFFVLDIPDVSESWLGTYYSCPLQLCTCVTMRTCISCMLHPKNLLLPDQAPQLKLSAQRQTVKSTLKTGSISYNKKLDKVGVGAQPLQWLLIFQQKKTTKQVLRITNSK